MPARARAAFRIKTPYRLRFADVVAAAPDFALAASFAIGWVRPYTPGIPSVRRLVMIVLLEFFIVHSSGFLAAVAIGERRRSQTIAFTLGLGVFYTLLLVAFSIGFNDWWLLASFWLLMGNRLLGLVIGQPPDDRRQMFVMSSWAVSVAAYLFAVTIGAVTEPPALGLTQAVVKAQEFSIGGLWTEKPQTAIVAGAIYFTVIALWELLVPPLVFRHERFYDEVERGSAVVTA
jgi:hypothetical protein